MLNEFINVDLNLALYYLVDFLIAVALLTAMRYLSGVVGNVSATKEIAQQDNNAFGISLAGALIAVSIMLMGVVSGDAGYNLADETINVLSFGVIGIGLMWLTRILFDRISFPGLSIHHEIMNGNVSASIIDACNMIATAIIIKGAMVWVEGDMITSIIAVVVSFVASQIIMALATLYRVKVYERRHKEKDGQLHHAIENNNIALALRFSAFRIGIAIAVSAAFTAVDYDAEALLEVFVLWFAVAVVLFFLLTVISIVIRLSVLRNVNIGEEVGEQHNIAVGAIEGSIYIVVGLLLAGLIGS